MTGSKNSGMEPGRGHFGPGGSWRPGPPRQGWPVLAELTATVNELRQALTLAAGRVVQARQRLDRLARNRLNIDGQRQRTSNRRRALIRAARFVQARLTRFDRERSEQIRRLKNKAARLAGRFNARPRPDRTAVSAYAEARMELLRFQAGNRPEIRRLAKWRQAGPRCLAKATREESRMARLDRLAAAYDRAIDAAGQVLADRRRELGQAASELVREWSHASRMTRLQQAQGRDLARLARNLGHGRAPSLPRPGELAEIRASIQEIITGRRTRDRLIGRIAAETEAGRRCLEQLGPLNRHIERAGLRLETALGLITPQAGPDYLCSAVLPRLEMLESELESLSRTARSTESRRERLASNLKSNLERVAHLDHPGPVEDLGARMNGLKRAIARGRAWEKTRRRELLACHKDLTALQAQGIFPDLAAEMDRLGRRHRALRQAWRAYCRRLDDLAMPALPVADAWAADPEADQVRRSLGLTRVKLTDLERTLELLRRSAEPLRARQRTLVDPQTRIARDERVRHLEALVGRLRLEVKTLTARRESDQQQVNEDAPRLRRMLADTAPVIAFLAGELEKSRTEARRLAREAADGDRRQTRIQADLDQTRTRAAEAEAELNRSLAETEASQLATAFLSRMLALTSVTGTGANQSLDRFKKALAARTEEVRILKGQLARLSVLYLQLLHETPPGKAEALAKRLSGFARRTLPQALAVILAAGSMLLVHPNMVSDAAYAPVVSTPAGPPPEAPPAPVRTAPRPVPLARIHYFPLNARIDLDGLTPELRAAGPRAVVARIDAHVQVLAQKARLTTPVFLDAVHRTLDTSRPIKLTALDGVAQRIRDFGLAHPHIFRDALRNQFLAQAMTLMEKVPLKTNRKSNWFRDRLYFDMVAAGMTRRQALAAVVTNARAAKALRRARPRKLTFVGRTRPLPVVEGMDLVRFVKRFSPFIADNCRRFLKARRQKVPADLIQYARRLAFDIYCAAKTFQVPLTLMLNIPHQETYYANVLGDGRRSASPFQIFTPTKRLILSQMSRQAFRVPSPRVKLENHLTLAAYLAAYHLRDLIDRQMVAYKKGRKIRWHCNLDNVVAAYNGSRKYIRGISQKRRHLIKYLKNTGRPRAEGSAKGPSTGPGLNNRG
jgi:chaperonin cofactor prefoldin